MLELSRLREVLHYNEKTGEFTWIKPTRYSSNMRSGEKAGSNHVSGYIKISIDRKIYSAHRLAWMYVNGEMPAKSIDHINGKKDDNRIANLRLATNQQNSENKRKPHSNNTHGFLGVSRQGSKWKARVRANGMENYIGLFDTPEQAHEAYKIEKARLHPFQTLMQIKNQITA